MAYERYYMKRCLFTSRCASHYENNVWDTMIKILRWGDIDIHIVYVKYSFKYGENQYICVLKYHLCVQKVNKCSYYFTVQQSESTLWRHAVVLQDGGALAPKAITKHPFFL